MNDAAIEQFVIDRVPHHASLPSAVLEHAAVQRGLEVRRTGRTVLFVRVEGASIPFQNLNGPDTGHVGQVLGTYADGQRELLRKRGLPVPRSGSFAASRRKSARTFAETLGWPVNVRPARLPYRSAAVDIAEDPEEFASAWDRAANAYDSGSKPILVEEQLAGPRHQLFVLGDRIVSATRVDGLPVLARPGFRRDQPTRPRAGAFVDVTDDASQDVRDLAVQALGCMPGMIYGAVDIVVPEPRRHVVTQVEPSPAPIAHFPSAGRPRDVAGAILDHYASAPRWRTARRTTHEPEAAGYARSIEPLFIGT